MFLELFLLLIGAYLLGSVPAGYLLIKLIYGKDIRQYGTGKIGASNVMHVGSIWLAIPVAIFDIGKGALAVYAARWLGMDATAQIAAGLAAIAGHNWPFFLGFKGGRGVFTSLGVITAISPWLGMLILAMPYILAPIKQVALGVFIALVSLPFFSWFLSGPLGIEGRLPITIGFAVLSLMALLTRVIVPRDELSRSVPVGQLIWNRLLFDRDISDQRAWTQRNLAKNRP